MLLAVSDVTYIPSRDFSFSLQGKSRVLRTRKQSVSKTRAGDRVREKREQQRQRRRETKKPNPMNSDLMTVIHQAQIVPENQTTNGCQTVTEIQPVKRKRLPKGKPTPYDIRSQPRPSRPRRNPLEEAVAERLRLEEKAEALAADLEKDLPPAKRPRLAARRAVRKAIIQKLTDGEELPPRPLRDEEDGGDSGDDDAGFDPGTDTEEEEELGTEFVSEQELDADRGLGADPELEIGEERATKSELDQEPEQGLEPGEEQGDAATAPNHRENGSSHSQHSDGTSELAVMNSVETCFEKKEKLKTCKKTTAANTEALSERRVTVDEQSKGSARTVTITARPRVAGAEIAEAEPEEMEGAEEAEGAVIDVDAIRNTEASDEEGNLAASMMLRLDISECLRHELYYYWCILPSFIMNIKS